MNEKEIMLVENSFRAIGGRGEAFIKRFYELFFALNPKAEAMFKETDLHMQSRKMLLTIMMVVDSLRDAAHLGKSLYQTHLVHKKFELSNEDYELLAEAMIKTFAEFLEDTWDDDYATAWQKALEQVAEMMLAPAL